MTLGTLLTIFVVPTMYTLFARKHAPGAIKTEVDEGAGSSTRHSHAAHGLPTLSVPV
jgi:multidrug efflux pump